MKKRYLVLTLLGLLCTHRSALAQVANPPSQIPSRPLRLPPGVPEAPGMAPPGVASEAASGLAKFDLDFPGGTPADLVEAIQKATRKPLNVIVPEEYAETKLPALKMKGVTVPQLFEALGAASRKTVPVVSGAFAGGLGLPYPQYQNFNVSYGFTTTGAPREDSIWFFHSDQPNLPPPQSPGPKEQKSCRFYQLGPLLDTYKIEDIIAALETAWKMLGETTVPEIKFHKDTHLLIAVGQADKLGLIDSVLQQLAGGTNAPAPRPTQRKVEPAKP